MVEFLSYSWAIHTFNLNRFCQKYRVFKTTFIGDLGLIIKAVTEVLCLGLFTLYSSALHPYLLSPTVVPDLWYAVNEYGLGTLYPSRAPLAT